jgi:hypothetical protein
MIVDCVERLRAGHKSVFVVEEIVRGEHADFDWREDEALALQEFTLGVACKKR